LPPESVTRRGRGGTRSRRRATKRRTCVDYAGRALWVYALSDDHVDRGALMREASGLRLVRPFSKPFWTFAGAQPGHRIPEPGGSGRTRKDTKQTAIKYERTFEEPRGYWRTRHLHGSGP